MIGITIEAVCDNCGRSCTKGETRHFGLEDEIVVGEFLGDSVVGWDIDSVGRHAHCFSCANEMQRSERKEKVCMKCRDPVSAHIGHFIRDSNGVQRSVTSCKICDCMIYHD